MARISEFRLPITAIVLLLLGATCVGRAIRAASNAHQVQSTSYLQLVPEPVPPRPNGAPPTPVPPTDVNSVGVIAIPAEPGDRIIVSGQIFAPNGITPAAGVFVYAYQTDSTGEYHNDSNYT